MDWVLYPTASCMAVQQSGELFRWNFSPKQYVSSSFGLTVVQSSSHIQGSLPQGTQHPGRYPHLQFLQVCFWGLSIETSSWECWGIITNPWILLQLVLQFSRLCVMHILLRVYLSQPTREQLLLRSLPRRRLLRRYPGKFNAMILFVKDLRIVDRSFLTFHKPLHQALGYWDCLQSYIL